MNELKPARTNDDRRDIKPVRRRWGFFSIGGKTKGGKERERERVSRWLIGKDKNFFLIFMLQFRSPICDRSLVSLPIC